jgi:hypothetical protein
MVPLTLVDRSKPDRVETRCRVGGLAVLVASAGEDRIFWLEGLRSRIAVGEAGFQGRFLAR